jgi:hypothetical protein
MATCQQPGTKYDLEKVRDYSGEPLWEYIRRYSETRLSIPNISNEEAISAFIKGLRYHDDFRNKLLRKRPTTVHDLLQVAKKWADAEDTDLQLKEDTGRLPCSDHAARRSDDRRDDRWRDEHRDDRRSDDPNRRYDNRDRRDNGRNRRSGRRDDFRRRDRGQRDDNTVNNVRSGGKRNYDDAYAKTLQGPCPAHPRASHTMGQCNGFRSIFRGDGKRWCGDASDDKQDDKQEGKKPLVEEEEKGDDGKDKNPHHSYQNPDRTVQTIFGGRVATETGRQRKLTARAVMVVTKTDDKIADVRVSDWSHQVITFNRADMWAKLP